MFPRRPYDDPMGGFGNGGPSLVYSQQPRTTGEYDSDVLSAQTAGQESADKGNGVPFDMSAWSDWYSHAKSPNDLSYDNFVSYGPSGSNGILGSNVARNPAGFSTDNLGRMLYQGKRLIY